MSDECQMWNIAAHTQSKRLLFREIKWCQGEWLRWKEAGQEVSFGDYKYRLSLQNDIQKQNQLSHLTRPCTYSVHLADPDDCIEHSAISDLKRSDLKRIKYKNVCRSNKSETHSFKD